MRETDYLHDEEPRELATSELVRELMQHGKHVFEVEARKLRQDLGRELSAARLELRDDVDTLVAEARERVTAGVTAVKQDVRIQVDRATSAAKPMAAGGVLLHASLYVLLAALVAGLATQMPLWVAALIVGVVVAGVGGLLLASGKRAAKAVGRNALDRTNRQLTENKRWMSEIKERFTARARSLTSGLKDDVWPRLRQSFAGGPVRTTSGNRLVAP